MCGLFCIVKDFTLECDCCSQIASVFCFSLQPPCSAMSAKSVPCKSDSQSNGFGFVVERMLVNLVGMGLFIH